MSNTFNSANFKIHNINPNPILVAANGSGGGGNAGGTGYTYTTTNASGYTLGEHVKINNNPASLEVKGNLVINGRDLEERLQTIEQVLQIPERDIELEKKYPKLKKLFEEYIKELSKRRMWEELKK
jgi:hypothetical protein